jgi:hypothetical protein
MTVVVLECFGLCFLGWGSLAMFWLAGYLSVLIWPQQGFVGLRWLISICSLVVSCWLVYHFQEHLLLSQVLRSYSLLELLLSHIAMFDIGWLGAEEWFKTSVKIPQLTKSI